MSAACGTGVGADTLRGVSAATPARISVASPRALGAFLLVTFAASWSCWFLSAHVDGPSGDVLGVAGRFGPFLGAVVAVATVDHGSFRDFLTSRMRSRGRWWYWPLAFLGPAVVILASMLIASAFGEDLGEFNDPSTLYLIVPAFGVVLVLGGPLGEEVGWRGVALDPLQKRFGPMRASVVLGVIWGVWHVPLFFDPSQIQQGLPILLYLGQTTATAFVYTWFWNRSMSLPLVMVLHASTNLFAGVFPLLVPEARSQLPFATAVAVTAAISVGIVVATRGSLGYDHRYTSATSRV